MTGGRLRLMMGKRDPFTPYHIPRALKYSEWDFERTPQIATSGSAITAFTDPITGASFSQVTGSAQPALDSDFNRRQRASFDGGDSLRNTTALATLGWPTSGAFEVWSLVDFIAATSMTWFAYPNSGNSGLSLSTNVTGAGVQQIRATVGTGSAQVAINATVGIIGRHLVRFISDGTNCRLDVDGVVGMPVAAVASFSGGPRNTIGGTAAATAGSLLTGGINYLMLGKALPAIYSDPLAACLLLRRG